MADTLNAHMSVIDGSFTHAQTFTFIVLDREEKTLILVFL